MALSVSKCTRTAPQDTGVDDSDGWVANSRPIKGLKRPHVMVQRIKTELCNSDPCPGDPDTIREEVTEGWLGGKGLIKDYFAVPK